MKKIFLVLLVMEFLVFVPVSLADWHVYKRVQIRNEDRHYLRFDRSNQGAVRAWLILRKAKAGAFQNKTMKYKIDDSPVQHVQGKQVRVREGRWIYWTLSCPEKKCLQDPELQAFGNGIQVVFQYEMPDGEIAETIFTLDGLDKAVAELE